jgi:hypothetical protein
VALRLGASQHPFKVRVDFAICEQKANAEAELRLECGGLAACVAEQQASRM